MIVATEITPREQLKKDIINYLRMTAELIDRDIIAQCLDMIKRASHNTIDLDETLDENGKRPYIYYTGWLKLKQVEFDRHNFYYHIANHFAPRHYASITEFVKRFESILETEWEEEERKSQELQDYLDSQRWWVQDREKYDDLLGEDYGPDGEIEVMSDRIMVSGFRKGLSSILPKEGKQHMGDKQALWRYPLSSLKTLQKTGLPVVYHPGCKPE